MPNLRAPKLRILPQNENYCGTPPPKQKKLSRINDCPSRDEGAKGTHSFENILYIAQVKQS